MTVFDDEAKQLEAMGFRHTDAGQKLPGTWILKSDSPRGATAKARATLSQPACHTSPTWWVAALATGERKGFHGVLTAAVWVKLVLGDAP